MNNSGTVQTAGMCRLIGSFVVRIWHKTGFIMVWLIFSSQYFVSLYIDLTSLAFIPSCTKTLVNTYKPVVISNNHVVETASKPIREISWYAHTKNFTNLFYMAFVFLTKISACCQKCRICVTGPLSLPYQMLRGRVKHQFWGCKSWHWLNYASLQLRAVPEKKLWRPLMALLFYPPLPMRFNYCLNPPPVRSNYQSTPHNSLSHLSRRLTRWAYRMGLEPVSIRASTLSNMNISETSRPITTKFYLKHHWGGGKAALGFDADQIRSLVSMATDSSHRVIMGKRASSRFLNCFWSDPFYTCR